MAAATGHRNRSLNRKSRAPLNGHDALAGNEPGALGGEEAHGVGDVAGSSHPPGGHRSEIGLYGVVEDVGVAFDGDEAGRHRVHGNAGWGQFAGLAEGQADLCALGGGVGGPARGRPVRDLGVDVHDTAVPAGLHPG
jgi:hypothetical protein